MRNDNEATQALKDFDNEADLHLWLADVVNDIHWTDREKEQGAKQLVEEVAYRLGTHGEQIVRQETTSDNSHNSGGDNQ